MRRREFIAALGSTAAWPVVARGQQTAIPVVGLIHIGAERDTRIDAIYRGLNEAGFFDGRNVIVDFRPTPNRSGVPALVSDLVRKKVAVIFGQAATALAAKAATSTIPIVFGGSSNPIAEGLVDSYSRPGGNVTGVLMRAGEEPTKVLELIHDFLPAINDVGLLIYPTVSAEHDAAAIEQSARTMGIKITMARASAESEFNAAFQSFAQARAGAVLVVDNVYLDTRRDGLVALAMRYALPAASNNREFAMAGGLASYGANIDDAARQCGVYIGRILKGEKPADLPVLQPAKFELVINLKTAKTLGLTVPPTLLARADEVIE
jgi:putative tryptophan/tyrosine transport system substrate-binding protein